MASIFDLFSEHEIGRELTMSAWLDAHRAPWSPPSCAARASSQPGAMGCRPSRCCAARCSRAAELRNWRFICRTPRRFAPLLGCRCIGARRSRLPISAISARTWERINRCLLASASETKVETGTLLRLDSTVTETMIHEPSDSWLLCDAMRIMVRLLDAPAICRRRRPLPGIITAGGPSGVPRPSIIAASRPSGRCCIET